MAQIRDNLPGILSWIVRLAIDLLLQTPMVFVLRILSMGIHELSHIVTCYCLTRRLPREFRIMPWGFYLNLDLEFAPLHHKAVILLAGPFSNLILWLVFSNLNMPEASEMNLTLCLFNLLPIPPLDGGELARATGLHNRLGRLQDMGSTIFGAVIILSGILNLNQGIRFVIPILCGMVLLTPYRSKGDTLIRVLENHMSKSRRLKENRLMEIRALAVNENTKIKKIAERMPCDSINVYCVMFEDMTPRGVVLEKRLLEAMMCGQMDQPVSAITDPLPNLSSQGRRAQVRGSKLQL